MVDDEKQKRFYERLMDNPRSGLAWAQAIFDTEPGRASKEDVDIASRCVAKADGSWLDSEWDQLHSARMSALRHKRVGASLEQALPSLWEREQAYASPRRLAGMPAWAKTIEQSQDRGIDAERSSNLAQKALESKSMASWLSVQTPTDLERLFDAASSLNARAAGVWQKELASRMGALHAWKVLADTFFRKKTGEASAKRSGMDRLAAKALAQTALGDPVLALSLLEKLYLDEFLAWRQAGGQELDPLSGVFDALTQNPVPALARLDGKAPSKLYSGSKAPLSLAMQLLCAGRFEAGLGAARWASAIGSLGRHPVGSRTDGARRYEFAMATRAVAGTAFNARNIAVNTLQEVAFALRKRSLAEALESLGWRMPNKTEIKRLSLDVGKSAKALGAANSRPLWDGAGPVDQAEEGTLAFWESMCLGKAVNAPKELGIKKTMRV